MRRLQWVRRIPGALEHLTLATFTSCYFCGEDGVPPLIFQCVRDLNPRPLVLEASVCLHAGFFLAGWLCAVMGAWISQRTRLSSRVL